MENYINNISNKITNKMPIKLQIREIILFAYCKFTNAWKFTPIIMDLKLSTIIGVILHKIFLQYI